MKCDECQRRYNYHFHINDEYWLKVIGEEKFSKQVGRLCAHCTLQKLGGLDWYIIFNEPGEHMQREQREIDATAKEIKPADIFEANEGKMLVTVSGRQSIDVRIENDLGVPSILLIIKDRNDSFFSFGLDFSLPTMRALCDALTAKLTEMSACTCGPREACSNCKVPPYNACPICGAIEPPPPPGPPRIPGQWYCLKHIDQRPKRTEVA